MEHWLSLKEAAAYLNASERKVRALIRKGVIKHARPEKKLLFKKQWLDQYALSYGKRLTPEQKKTLEELS